MNVRDQFSKYFTVAEAIQVLHGQYPLIREMVDISRILKEKKPAVSKLKIIENMERLTEIINLLGREGVLVKGVEEGLVDFPHFRPNGETVFLCYRLGEKSIEFWHPIEGGYRARQPLEAL
ncbi:MAG: DUF2203 family protein [Calditrichia bacterium]